MEADHRHEHVVDVARQRLARAAAWLDDATIANALNAQCMTGVFATRLRDMDRDGLARRMVAHLLETLHAYRTRTSMVYAMASRLVPHWEWSNRFDDAETLIPVVAVEATARALGLYQERHMLWPTSVSLDDVARTLDAARDPIAHTIAASIRSGEWELGDIGGHTHLVRGIGAPLTYFPRVAAWVAWAEATVVEAQRAARSFPLSTRRESHAAVDFLARPSSLRGAEQQGVRVVWHGSRGEQLSFAFAQLDIQAVYSIRQELGPEGLRDWAILHRLAAEQGGTGTVRWTWAEHRRNTLHESRVRDSTCSDDDLRNDVVQRIHRLAQAELWARRERDGRWAEIRLGNQGFVGIDARGGARRHHSDVMMLRLNPVLYEGARRGVRHPHYTLVPEGLLRLSAGALSLGMLISFRQRYRADDGGCVVLDDDDVLRFLDSNPARSRNAVRSQAMIARHLDAVMEAMSDGARWERIDARVHVYPPRWWTDHTLHGAERLLPAPWEAAPSTGTELSAWRARRGLSQCNAARALGVSERTLRRAEAQGETPLPRSFARANWAEGAR